MLRTRSAMMMSAALAFATLSSPAIACIVASDMYLTIHPTVPKAIPSDAIVLKVLLDKEPNIADRSYRSSTLSVLKVVKGRYRWRSINLNLRPSSSCNGLGVVGRPGYVVLRRYPFGYQVIGGRFKPRDAGVAALRR